MKTLSALVTSFVDHLIHHSTPTAAASVTCSADGAPPMPTVAPVTFRPHAADGGRVLSFEQEGVTRYACLNFPAAAQADQRGRKWPLLIYLHGSRATPGSIYTLGRKLFALRDRYPLCDDPAVRGFILLSPMGRRAAPWQSVTGTGFHWDSWYRNPTANLDALAVDHFLDEVIAGGQVDARHIYVFGWSNGADMAALYGVWRSDRIAAIAQYAGGDPWSRTPCPVPFRYSRKVPLMLLRNLCDALVPYGSATQPWIETLQKEQWPFAYQSLDLLGFPTAPDRPCANHCGKVRGIFEHVRFPQRPALERMLQFLREHPLP